MQHHSFFRNFTPLIISRLNDVIIVLISPQYKIYVSKVIIFCNLILKDHITALKLGSFIKYSQKV